MKFFGEGKVVFLVVYSKYTHTCPPNFLRYPNFGSNKPGDSNAESKAEGKFFDNFRDNYKDGKLCEQCK